MRIAVELDAVTKTYRPRQHPATTALHALNLRVPVGQFLGILGAPGAGKTTLLRLIGGLLAPTTGHVRVFGLDTSRERVAVLGHVATVLAGSLNVSWQRTVQDTLLADAQCRRLDQVSSDRRVAALLSALDLSSPSDAPIGYRRAATWTRLAIASALLADPPVLVLDEPTLDLDEHDAASLVAWLGRLAREHGKTVILASRHVGAVGEHCDRVVLLNEGRCALDRPAADLGNLDRSGTYQITVKGQLAADWSDWFEGLAIAPTSDGATVLSGPIADQSALHGLLVKVRDLGLPLVSLTRVEPDLGDIINCLTRGRVSGVRCQETGDFPSP